MTVAAGQPVLVENHPGASGNIGSEVVPEAPAEIRQAVTRWAPIAKAAGVRPE